MHRATYRQLLNPVHYLADASVWQRHCDKVTVYTVTLLEVVTKVQDTRVLCATVERLFRGTGGIWQLTGRGTILFGYCRLYACMRGMDLKPFSESFRHYYCRVGASTVRRQSQDGRTQQPHVPSVRRRSGLLERMWVSGFCNMLRGCAGRYHICSRVCPPSCADKPTYAAA